MLINLNLLPEPEIIEQLDFETIFNARKARLIQLWPESQQQALIETLSLDSEPLVKLLQENAYRELLLRQRINNASKSVMLAYAKGRDLDVLAANYNVYRLVITPADNTTTPAIPAEMESDDDLRLRIQQSFEGLTTAGSTASYEYHARSASGNIADVSACSDTPAEVIVTVLSRLGNGHATQELLKAVESALNSETIRPVGDRVIVRSAEIITYQINADIHIESLPEYEVILKAAESRLNAYINQQRRLGRGIHRSAIFAVLTVEGVDHIELHQPTSDLQLNLSQAAWCRSYEINPVFHS